MPLDIRPESAVSRDQPDALEHLGCGSRWAVCQTHQQAERWALANLTRQGFDAYLPLHIVQRRDRVVPSMFHNVAVPLFTGYVFVGIRSPYWAPIQHTLGVSKLLLSGEKPYLLPAGVLEAVQAGDEVRRCLTPPKPPWAPGAAIRVGKGIFQGHGGVVLSADADTARVGLMFLGQLRTVALPAEFLVARDGD